MVEDVLGSVLRFQAMEGGLQVVRLVTTNSQLHHQNATWPIGSPYFQSPQESKAHDKGATEETVSREMRRDMSLLLTDYGEPRPTKLLVTPRSAAQE